MTKKSPRLNIQDVYVKKRCPHKMFFVFVQLCRNFRYVFDLFDTSVCGFDISSIYIVLCFCKSPDSENEHGYM